MEEELKTLNAPKFEKMKITNQSRQKQVKQVPCVVATTESKTSPDNADQS